MDSGSLRSSGRDYGPVGVFDFRSKAIAVPIHIVIPAEEPG